MSIEDVERRRSERRKGDRRRTPRPGQERRVLIPQEPRSAQFLRDARWRGAPALERRLAECISIQSGIRSLLEDLQFQDVDICVCGQPPEHHGDPHEGDSDHEFTSAITEALARINQGGQS